MNAEVAYRLALLKEAALVSLKLLALKLRLITVSCEEWQDLTRRAKQVRILVANLKGDVKE